MANATLAELVAQAESMSPEERDRLAEKLREDWEAAGPASEQHPGFHGDAALGRTGHRREDPTDAGRRLTVQAAFAGSRSVFLDTAPAIYALLATSPFNATAQRAMTYCVSSGIEVLTSPVTLAESLAGKTDLLRQFSYHRYLSAQGIRMVDIDVSIAEVTGHLRRTTKLKFADRLQLATALVAGCDTFLTNDAQLAKTSVTLGFVLMSDLT